MSKEVGGMVGPKSARRRVTTPSCGACVETSAST